MMDEVGQVVFLSQLINICNCVTYLRQISFFLSLNERDTQLNKRTHTPATHIQKTDKM